MKLKICLLFIFGLVLSSNLDENQDFDIVDEEEGEGEDGPSDHLTPDINCLVNDFPQFFGFPEKQVNARIEPQELNEDIDPFVVFLNSRLQDKEEDIDDFITIDDINAFYGLEDEQYTNLKIMFDECSKIPKKFSLNILELNYLFCTILWQQGFTHLTDKLTDNEEYKQAFYKIVSTTVSEIFDYKTYIKELRINKYTTKYWMKFYENLLEFNDINNNYESYDQTTIVKIKERNFFFNEDKYKTENWFFNFYKNLEDIMRSINHSIYYFYIQSDVVMNKVKMQSEVLQDVLMKDVYGSIFYLFMREDKFFIENVKKIFVQKGFFIKELQESIDKFTIKFETYIQDRIDNENNFEFNEELEEKDKTPRALPSTNPMYFMNTNLYNVPDIDKGEKSIIDQLGEKKLTAKQINKQLHKRDQEKDDFRRNVLNKKKLMDFGKIPTKHNQRILEVEQNYKEHQKLFVALEQINNQKKQSKKSIKKIRKLFQLPSQPDLSDPSEFFSRIDVLKKPLSIRKKRMTLTEFFDAYEERTKEYYGNFANIQLIELCKEQMQSKIPAIANIFCLIVQRESSLLLQQKYANSKVKAFFSKYFKFIAFNFFTYFNILEDKGDLLEIVALTLFFNEKYFAAVKLAIVSFNNLLLHFEEEYRDYYNEIIEKILIPIFNKFKVDMHKIYIKYEDELIGTRLEDFEITEDELKLEFLPKFRNIFNDKVLAPINDITNLQNLKNQYQNYMEGMNLLSYDRIRKQFLQYQKDRGIKVSSEPPSSECQNLHLSDLKDMHQKALAMNNDEEIDDEENCVKNWKLYDDVFHYVFYNVSSKDLIIKKKTDVDSPTQKNLTQNAIQNELIKVVNGFIPDRMKEYIEDFQGEYQNNMEKCGVQKGSSLIKCYSIFGQGNCDKVNDTIYYTRKCPKGYIRDQLACVYNCEAENLRSEGEFCIKNEDESDLACPDGLVPDGDLRCMKPVRRYFPYIMNPFNNKL